MAIIESDKKHVWKESGENVECCKVEGAVEINCLSSNNIILLQAAGYSTHTEYLQSSLLLVQHSM